jgi:hypothetical protein
MRRELAISLSGPHLYYLRLYLAKRTQRGQTAEESLYSSKSLFSSPNITPPQLLPTYSYWFEIC